MDATFEIAFAGVEKAEAAADRLRSEGFGVELRFGAGEPANVLVTQTLSIDHFDVALSRMQSLVSELDGSLVAHWQSEWNETTRRAATRSASKDIYRLARGIADGRTQPAQALNEILATARVSQPPGKIIWEETAIWPLYGRFHAIAIRWYEAQQAGDMTREVTGEFEAEVVDAAHDLLRRRV